MNAVFFGAKRVFQSAVAVTRPVLQSVSPGMTAARFDMMVVIGGERHPASSLCKSVRLRQSQLRQRLGVSAPVVSRMLRSLEALGWVRRQRPPRPDDQRQRLLELTDEGLACIRAAFKLAHRFAKRLVHRALCHRRHRDRNAQHREMDQMEGRLSALRTYCGDTATLWYWWPSPDD
jgi:DNA-binding MarR family transcriptional regulator